MNLNGHSACLGPGMEYAARGIPVIPVGGPSFRPMQAWKDRQATTPDEVAMWFQHRAHDAMALRTGHRSGFAVLDIDVKNGHDGVESLKARGIDPYSLSPVMARSPSGGLHVYFHQDRPLKGGAGFLPGVDFRADGNLIYAPPSVRHDGTYEWLGEPLGSPEDLPAIPQEILEIVQPFPVSTPSPGRPAAGQLAPPVMFASFPNDRGRAILNEACERVRTAPKGTRNETLNAQAHRCGREVQAGNLTFRDAEQALRAAALECGLGEREIDNTVRRALCDGASASAAAMPAPLLRKSAFFRANTLIGKAPPREWFVKDLIPLKTTTMLSGDGGTGKSLIALQLAACGAAGKPWLGQPMLRQETLYIGAEDERDEIWRRLENINAAIGCTPKDLALLSLRSLAGEDALLAIDGTVLNPSALYSEIDQYAAQTAPKLIVLDTLADLYPANENDRAKVRQFVQFLNRLALKRECAVLLLSHPSLTGMSQGTGASGSTGWNNSVRSRLYLTRDDADDDRRALKTMKSNYGKVGGEIIVEYRKGAFVRVDPADQKSAAETIAETVFLKLARQYAREGRSLNPNSGPNYAPSQFARHPDNERLTKAAFTGAMNRLLADGRVRIVDGARGTKALEVV